MTRSLPIPITDDHIHIDPVNGRGLEAAKDFRAGQGGTHLFLVSKPSWSFGITPSKGEDFIPVFEGTLSIARKIRDLGIVVFPVPRGPPGRDYEARRIPQASPAQSRSWWKVWTWPPGSSPAVRLSP